jgi:hypothetical protein
MSSAAAAAAVTLLVFIVVLLVLVAVFLVLVPTWLVVCKIYKKFNTLWRYKVVCITNKNAKECLKIFHKIILQKIQQKS